MIGLKDCYGRKHTKLYINLVNVWNIVCSLQLKGFEKSSASCLAVLNISDLKQTWTAAKKTSTGSHDSLSPHNLHNPDVVAVSSSILAVSREREFVCQFCPFKTHNFESKSLLLPIALTSDHRDNFGFVAVPFSEKKLTTFSEARRAKFPKFPQFKPGWSSGSSGSPQSFQNISRWSGRLGRLVVSIWSSRSPQRQGTRGRQRCLWVRQ